MTTPTDQEACGRLVAVSVSPAEMTECGLSPGHEGECIPYTSLKSKRKVNYNQQAVLCPCCTKRIRLNNSGRLRVHVAGKVGSDKCLGSNSMPILIPVEVLASQIDDDKQAWADVVDDHGNLTEQVLVVGTKPTELGPKLFSDIS